MEGLFSLQLPIVYRFSKRLGIWVKLGVCCIEISGLNLVATRKHCSSFCLCLPWDFYSQLSKIHMAAMWSLPMELNTAYYTDEICPELASC